MNFFCKGTIWLGLFIWSAKAGLGEIYCVASGILMIFLNLGQRKGASAYSVFNEGYGKLAGEIDPTAMLKRKTKGGTEVLVEPEFVVKSFRLANKPCPCGSGKKHKKCCLHAKDDDLN